MEIALTQTPQPIHKRSAKNLSERDDVSYTLRKSNSNSILNSVNSSKNQIDMRNTMREFGISSFRSRDVSARNSNAGGSARNLAVLLSTNASSNFLKKPQIQISTPSNAKSSLPMISRSTRNLSVDLKKTSEGFHREKANLFPKKPK